MEEKKEIVDDYGNKIISTNNGETISLLIKLAKEKYNRHVGFINIRTKTLHVLRERGKHLFMKNNSYGFNYLLISKAKQFHNVFLQDEYGSYLFPSKLILTEGNFLNFKQKGFELQIFLSLDIINQYKQK